MNFKSFVSRLKRFIPPDRLLDDPLKTLAYGTDASFYRLNPRLVVTVENLEEMQRLLVEAHAYEVPVTFRAAGTSLSGQSVTDSVLVRLGHGWTDHRILEEGRRIALQPGLIGAQANRLLAPYKRKIGPDPASIDTAKIGGIAANNASGMCCGVAQNSYHTLHSMKLVLADGSTLDTGCDTSRQAFERSHGSLLQGLKQLSDDVKTNPELAAKIARKYRLKNTTGYGINALIDHKDPIEILQHLLIGSEGTLGFMAEVTYNTVVDATFKSSAFLCFPSVEAACDAVQVLKTANVSAVELIDNSGLQAIQDMPGVPDFLIGIDTQTTALLVDVRGESEAELAANTEAVKELCNGLFLSRPCEFSTCDAIYQSYWKVRKGLFPAVGANRDSGTTVVIEDVAFPVEQLAEAVLKLHGLFQHHGYHEALIFGHALEGNLHFVFAQAFDTQAEIDCYDAFMQDVAKLVVDDYEGALKAEHGTGRNMAPFVKYEWGEDAYNVMWRIKELFDPKGILNPGVLLNLDEQVHLKNLKPMAPVSDLVDKCIECGFCEPSCPSRALTLTPRQRISVQREMARLRQSSIPADHQRLAAIATSYTFDGEETCAACGLCEVACPVDINTGDLTRHLRSLETTKLSNWLAWRVTHHFGLVLGLVRGGLWLGRKLQGVLGPQRAKRWSAGIRRLSGQRLPLWLHSTPDTVAHWQPEGCVSQPDNKVVYFSGCANRAMGPATGGLIASDQRSLQEATVSLLNKAGFEVVMAGEEAPCCGMPMFSKGLAEQGEQLREQTLDALWVASESGRWPVISDMSPCSSQLLEAARAGLQLEDAMAFIDRQVVDRLDIKPLAEPLALHVPCSAVRMGLTSTMRALAELCAERVLVPDDITCCGFAGDKGFFSPELNANALRSLAQQLPADCQRGVSSSRTCEIGLSEHSERPYQSLIYVLDEVSRVSH